MKNIVNVVALAVAAFSLSAFAAGPAAAESITVVGSPQTASEHQRLGELYTEKALKLESDADWHDKMPRFYASATKGSPGTAAHCRALHDKLSAEAKVARADALEQFKLAAAAEK